MRPDSRSCCRKAGSWGMALAGVSGEMTNVWGPLYTAPIRALCGPGAAGGIATASDHVAVDSSGLVDGKVDEPDALAGGVVCEG